jgi:hypothetical protein
LVAIDRNDIFKEIVTERERQDELHPLKYVKETNDDDVKVMSHYLLQNEMLAVLIEEVGEIGKALQGEGDLKEELIQTASVCVRWLENIK